MWKRLRVRPRKTRNVELSSTDAQPTPDSGSDGGDRDLDATTDILIMAAAAPAASAVGKNFSLGENSDGTAATVGAPSARNVPIMTPAELLRSDVISIAPAAAVGDEEVYKRALRLRLRDLLARAVRQAAETSGSAAEEEVAEPEEQRGLWLPHRAAYVDDLDAFTDLTRGWSAADWSEQLDCCGNTVLHVAALRGSHRCLKHALARGCPAGALNSAGWTALQECRDAYSLLEVSARLRAPRLGEPLSITHARSPTTYAGPIELAPSLRRDRGG